MTKYLVLLLFRLIAWREGFRICEFAQYFGSIIFDVVH